MQAVLDSKYLSKKEWQSIKQLNELRNRLAHNLEPKGIKDIIKDFLDKSDDEIKKGKAWQDGNDETRLKMSISMLCGKLANTYSEML